MLIRSRFVLFVFALMLCGTVSAQTHDEQDIKQLRNELAQLRQEYQARIQKLEQRIDALETQPAAQPAAASGGGMLSGLTSSDFNPAIGVIFSGRAWRDNNNPDTVRLPGFPAGGEAGAGPKGVAIGETELSMSANVDDKFTAWLTMPIVVDNGDVNVELEEAWIETLGLPHGFAARFGRFFSGIGYQNSRHSHTWDFIDQPLAYQAFLGGQYLDDGVQVRWLAPTDLYMEFGGEVMRGSRYPAVGAVDSGFGSHALFAHFGGDASNNSSWLAGLSWLHTGSNSRVSGNANNPLSFSGNDDLLIADFVWKWAPQGNWRQRNFILQGEYLWRNETGNYTLANSSVLPYDANQSGWYVQGVYQPFPHWRFGARFDTLSSDNPGAAFTGTELDPLTGNPVRVSVMTDWSNSEFSRLRLQFSHLETDVMSDNQWGLQYIFSIGAHGAHTF